MMRFYKMGNYSYEKERFLRIQRQSRQLIIPLAWYVDNEIWALRDCMNYDNNRVS